MKTSQAGLDLIKSFEGYRDRAYNDGCDVITIGYGTTRYPNGYKIQIGDKCTKEQAEEYLAADLKGAEQAVNNLVFAKELTQGQFDALVSFAYNAGVNALKSSTLYQKARVNPDDESIFNYNDKTPADSCEFLRWCKGTILGKKVVMTGLVRRRQAEADLYSGKKGGVRPPKPH